MTAESKNQTPPQRFSRIALFVFLCFVISCSQEIGLPEGKIVTQISCDGNSETLTPGDVVYGSNNYVEFFVGDSDCPIILTAPHGGHDKPSTISDRINGVLIADESTQELTRAIADAIHNLIGKRPHVIINKLHRSKMDANRPVDEAAQGNVEAIKAWEEYHCFIETASSMVQQSVGSGMLWDMHGHGHAINRVEIGYLLNNNDLANSDDILDNLFSASSIHALAVTSDLTFSELIRGPSSFGSLLKTYGFNSVPSTDDPEPGVNNEFFEGGYTTQRHGSLSEGNVSAIQLECNRPGLRDTEQNRKLFAEAMAKAVKDYLITHYGFSF